MKIDKAFVLAIVGLVLMIVVGILVGYITNWLFGIIAFAYLMTGVGLDALGSIDNHQTYPNVIKIVFWPVYFVWYVGQFIFR